MHTGTFKLGLARGLVFCVMGAALSGCLRPPEATADKIPPPQTTPVVLDVRGVKPAVDYSDLAAVLRECVRKGGHVEPVALKRVVDRLDAQVKRLAVTGPTATPKLLPGEDDRLAYWLNARAAWALALALRNGCPEALPAAALEACALPLDGRKMTLRDIDAVLAGDKDWRAIVVAPGIRANRARLPTRPFAAKDVRERIAARLSEFLDDPDRFEIDQAEKLVRVPPILDPIRRRLIDEQNRKRGTASATLMTALLEHVTGSAHRRLQDAIGLRCVRAGDTDKVVFPRPSRYERRRPVRWPRPAPTTRAASGSAGV